MGGNAFKDLNVVSIERHLFEEISVSLIRDVRKILKSEYVKVLPYYKNKKVFGDIDIMITREDLDFFERKNGCSFFDHLTDKYNLSSVRNDNDNIISIPLKIAGKNEYVQVDFMPHEKSEFTKKMKFYAFNDFHLFVNKFIAEPVFDGHVSYDGFKTKSYIDDDGKNYFLGEIQTIDKFDETLSFLKFDIERFKKGFDDVEDIFMYVYSNPYFSTDNFEKAVQVQNNVERERLKRKGYVSFINFIRSMPHKKGKIVGSESGDIVNHFSQLRSQRDKLVDDFYTIKTFKERFNGININKIVKIEDSKVLGVFIKSLGFDHRKLKVDDFVLSIVAMNDREFENFVFKEYSDFKESPVQSFKKSKKYHKVI